MTSAGLFVSAQPGVSGGLCLDQSRSPRALWQLARQCRSKRLGKVSLATLGATVLRAGPDLHLGRLVQAADNAVAGARLVLQRHHVADVDAAAAHVDDLLLLQQMADRRHGRSLHPEETGEEL